MFPKLHHQVETPVDQAVLLRILEVGTTPSRMCSDETRCKKLDITHNWEQGKWNSKKKKLDPLSDSVLHHFKKNCYIMIKNSCIIIIFRSSWRKSSASACDATQIFCDSSRKKSAHQRYKPTAQQLVETLLHKTYFKPLARNTKGRFPIEQPWFSDRPASQNPRPQDAKAYQCFRSAECLCKPSEKNQVFILMPPNPSWSSMNFYTCEN